MVQWQYLLYIGKLYTVLSTQNVIRTCEVTENYTNSSAIPVGYTMSVVTKLRVDDNRPRSVLKHHTCIIAMHAVPPLWFYALRPKSLATYNTGFWVCAVDIANIRCIQSSLSLAQTTMVHALGLYARVRRFADNSPTEPKHFSTSLNFSAYQVTNFFPYNDKHVVAVWQTIALKDQLY